MPPLTLVSLLAENARPLFRAVAGYLAEHCGLPAQLSEGLPWAEQERMLDAGAADAGFLCGLLYTHKAGWLELLAAPVMQGPRYAGRPVYFSDVVVPRGSRFQSFADLRGAAWLYNDRGSFSGYAVLRAHLADLGEAGAFCGPIRASGGHVRSLELVAAGQADAAAIDSTVLDLERARRPALAEQLRVVATLGPSPIPPAVAGLHLPAEVRERLRAALLGMHRHPAGRAALAAGLVERFVPVHDHDYDAIRATAGRAERVRFQHGE